MQRVLIVLSVLLACCTMLALAQGKPTVELSDAYMFTNVPNVFISDTSGNVPAGEDTSVNVPINNWFGGVGDFGFFTKSMDGVTASVYTYGGGPQFTLRTPNVQPYFRLIIGGAYGTTSNFGPSNSINAFFLSPGGGADFAFRITSGSVSEPTTRP